MASHTVMNFAPGPAKIPEEVLQQAHSEFFNYNNTGMSIVDRYLPTALDILVGFVHLVTSFLKFSLLDDLRIIIIFLIDPGLMPVAHETLIPASLIVSRHVFEKNAGTEKKLFVHLPRRPIMT
ncbi:hypothetical protein TNIN_155721 [Trichonephila inaurata madagascariensis]|uniref:Uncharacterized protein n=1 Tax=Trichonephila inaurata madagascariensis TaxID=2747483 RepID=A0A8X6WTI7_9ARAC|nr:hypothetical protein TNIN_155721 [Trichonephila inaurata madagascariensis]